MNMSEDDYGRYFPFPDYKPKGFNGDPEAAVEHVRRKQVDRLKLSAFRSSLAYFDEWRPKSSALPWVERVLGYLPVIESKGERGPAPDPQQFVDMKSLGEAVKCSCLSSAGHHKLAARVLSRARVFKPSPLFAAVVDNRMAPIVLELDRFSEAEELAERAVGAFQHGEKSMKPFCSRDMTLLTRGNVLGSRYLFDRRATGDVQLLLRVVSDAQEVLCSRAENLASYASAMLVAASACMCFAGLKLPECPEVPKLRGRLQNAKGRWSQALLSCASSRYLSEESENQFRSAREDMFDLGLTQDVIHVTLDLQFWLIVSTRLRHAAAESHVIRPILPILGNREQEDAVASWLSEVDQLILSYSTAQRVLSEVRQVGKPNNLRLLLAR